MKKNKKRQQDSNWQTQKANNNATGENIERLSQQTEQNEKRKPGSQSNSSKQHNNGRGGGK